jgi:hypothetical protein
VSRGLFWGVKAGSGRGEILEGFIWQIKLLLLGDVGNVVFHFSPRLSFKRQKVK